MIFWDAAALTPSPPDTVSDITTYVHKAVQSRSCWENSVRLKERCVAIPSSSSCVTLVFSPVFPLRLRKAETCFNTSQPAKTSVCSLAGWQILEGKEGVRRWRLAPRKSDCTIGMEYLFIQPFPTGSQSSSHLISPSGNVFSGKLSFFSC